jgi:hypothetical protein
VAWPLSTMLRLHDQVLRLLERPAAVNWEPPTSSGFGRPVDKRSQAVEDMMYM